MSFSPKQFREALQESAKLQQKFQKFVSECKKQSIEFIYFMIEEFQKIIVDKEPLLLKVNAVFALQILIQTAEYATIQFIESWLLPHLQEVALFHADKRTYAKTSTFFREKGFPTSTPNIQQLSHNYVTLVTQFVFFAAAVKDSYYFYTDRLNCPSAFKQLATKLRAKGLEPREKNAQQLKKLEQLHQQYEQNLYEFENAEQTYVDFFKQRVQRFIVEGGRVRQSLDIRKLLKNNDSWLCSEIIGMLHDALEHNQFQIRRNSLALINELFISGDIQTIMLMNEGEAMEQIFDKILEVKGTTDIGRGAMIYPEINGQMEQKKNFYIDYMRCLQTWSKLCPTAIYLNSDQQSKMAKFYNELKQKQFIFPSNEILNKYKKQFDQNMKKNQIRNDYIVQQLNEGDTSKNKSHSHKLSRYSHKISLIKEMRESTILTLSEIEKMIEESEFALKKLSIGERELSKNMKTLNYFSQEFQKKFGLIEESVTQSRLENIYERGYKCLEKIQELGPHYQDYQNGKIDYSKFTEVIARGFSQIDKSKSKSKASEILSKLSKSKDGFSKSGRSGLELSKSFSKKNQIQTNNAKEPIQKTDYILEKSQRGDRQSPAPRDSLQFTKTIVNMSNLQNGSRVSELSRNTSKKADSGKKQNNEKGKDISKDISKVSEYSHSEKQSDKGPQTAKFILEEDNSQHSIHSFEKRKPSNIREVDQEYEKSSVYTHKLEKSDNKVLQSGKSPSMKQKQEFSGDSSWSEEQEKVKKSHLSKGMSKREENKLTSNMRSPNQTIQQNVTKSREEFSDSSFSEYNESNEQIREVIDKSQNPDFKMLFKQKNSQNHSNNSRLSKRTIQSHEHYLAVLESLAPKSIHDQTDKEISRYSKDKSASQLPPKSNYDMNSKIDNNINYNLKQAKSSISQSEISEQASNLKVVTKKENSSNYHPTLKSNNTALIHSKSNDFRREKSKFEKEDSKFKESSKEKPEIFNSFSQNHAQSNSMFPPQMNEGNSISRGKNDGKKIMLENSNSVTSKSPQGSKLSKDGQSKISSSKLSLPIRTNQKKGKEHEGESNRNSKILEEYQMDLNKITQSKLQNEKEKKIREIKELQKRLAMLKGEQQKLYIVRSDYQSPTRPLNLRTALSPRFRNNQPTPTEAQYQNHEQNFRRDNAQFYKAQHKPEEMNFDVVDLFKPPEGRLVYSRLYKKDLEQVNLRERRKILKGKDLVFRNEEIEVGMMIHRDLKDLKIIYYITASKYIKTFLFKIQPTSKLSIHAIPGELSNLQPSKQYRIYLFAQVLQFPYKMPIIHFKYHPNLLSIQQNLFIQNQVNHFTSIIPFFFTKFLTMKPVTIQQMQEQWVGEIARGEETAYSKKLLPKHFYILQYYPDMLNLENKEYESVYAVECEYGNTRFLLKLVIKINKFFYIQGILTAFRDKQNSEKIMEYCICCMNQLLSKPEKNILLQ